MGQGGFSTPRLRRFGRNDEGGRAFGAPVEMTKGLRRGSNEADNALDSAA